MNRLTIDGNDHVDEIVDMPQLGNCCGPNLVNGNAMSDWQRPQWYVRGSING